MSYKQTFENCFGDATSDHDWLRTAFLKSLAHSEKIASSLEVLRDKKRLPILSLPYETEDLDRLAAHPIVRDKKFKRYVVVGIGGSSLGGQVLVNMRNKVEEPYIHFWDTLDYHVMKPHFESRKLKETAFILISKSGTTPEIMAQTLMVIEALNNLGGADAVGKHCLVICEPGENPLGLIADKWGIERMDHDPNIGGRFSCLSLVGALPAMLAGIDMYAVREGARKVLDDALINPEAAPRAAAALNYALYDLYGVKMNVLMPYAKQLEPFTHWYRQLWAESIGKDGRGSTPLNALGPIDQHSQLQLWLDGPNDKFFTLVINHQVDDSPIMDVSLADNLPALEYLRDHRISDVVLAEANATAKTLADRGKYLRCIYIDRLDEKTIGELLMHYMLETIFTCNLLDVNPFDQPAVEDGKKLTKMYLKGAE
jgi:glucose-6-phosphate isomerase